MPTIKSSEVRAVEGGYVLHRTYVERDIPGDRVHLASRDDTSPVQVGGYDARCASCWLGHGHSERKHAQGVQR